MVVQDLSPNNHDVKYKYYDNYKERIHNFLPWGTKQKKQVFYFSDNRKYIQDQNKPNYICKELRMTGEITKDDKQVI